MDWNFIFSGLVVGIGTAVTAILAVYQWIVKNVKELESRLTRMETQMIARQMIDDETSNKISSILDNCRQHVVEITELKSHSNYDKDNHQWLTSNLTLLTSSLNKIGTGVEVMTNSIDNVSKRLNNIEAVTKELAGEIRDVVKIVNRHDIEIQILKEKR